MVCRAVHLSRTTPRANFTPCKRIGKTRSQGPTPALRRTMFTLQIDTTHTSPQHGCLINRFEEPDSVITSLHAGPLERYDRCLDELSDLTPDEKKAPGFIGDTLPLESIWRDRSGKIVDETHKTYRNRKGYFTVAEVVKLVEKFERLDRPKSSWFGGVDCHHTYFEGMRPNESNTAFCIAWGS